MQTKVLLEQFISQAILDITGLSEKVILDVPKEATHGDFTTSIALSVFAKSEKGRFENPRTLAEKIKDHVLTTNHPSIGSISVAGAGYLNIVVSNDYLFEALSSLISKTESYGLLDTPVHKRVMVEYAHPNTHKEMHVGHMRTLITGEAIARLYESASADVFRANYQGDIGLHVAKALYGVQKLLVEENITPETIESKTPIEKAHFLGIAYAKGSSDYEEKKEEIDTLNKALYTKTDENVMKLYKITRQWSLEYYESFYDMFYTHFDRLFFESEMVEDAVKIVKQNTPGVFTFENNAYTFKGEPYGLHTRVFVTGQDYPTYEGKDVANAYHQYEVFPFDRNIHVVANEQTEYFKVVFKALSLLDPEKFADSEYHMSMGMVNLVGKKISSRTGEVVTVDSLVEAVKKKVAELVREGRMETSQKEALIEMIAIGAIKYSLLKVAVSSDVTFDLEKSVSLDGDSGPYVQYTYARTQSILEKGGEIAQLDTTGEWDQEERALAHMVYRFVPLVEKALSEEAPHIIANYLFSLSQSFNTFYQKVPVLKSTEEEKNRRLFLVSSVGKTLLLGLDILGIKAPERM